MPPAPLSTFSTMRSNLPSCAGCVFCNFAQVTLAAASDFTAANCTRILPPGLATGVASVVVGLAAVCMAVGLTGAAGAVGVAAVVVDGAGAPGTADAAVIAALLGSGTAGTGGTAGTAGAAGVAVGAGAAGGAGQGLGTA